jgi:hypothetical protein
MIIQFKKHYKIAPNHQKGLQTLKVRSKLLRTLAVSFQKDYKLLREIISRTRIRVFLVKIKGSLIHTKTVLK